jgi:ferritin
MLSQAMQDALNEQINAELWSAYLYLSMATHFESVNLPGMAKWMRVQTNEEYAHAMKFMDHIHDRAGRALLKPIAAVPTEWKSPLEAFEATLKHEQEVTSRIHKLMDQAVAAKDHATANMLQWFVSEQVEEEANAVEIVNKLKLLADSKGALYWLDHELGKRGGEAD